MREDLLGLMGMCEMECAIEVMLNKAQKMKIPFKDLEVSYEDFKDDDNTMIGFCCLLYCNWMDQSFPERYFKANKDLLDRLRKRNLI